MTSTIKRYDEPRNLREPAGTRATLGHAREITHHAHCGRIPLRIRWLPYAIAQPTVHGGSV